MAFTLEELEHKARENRRAMNERLRQRYRLARELGFNTYEAQILSFKTEVVIRRLALQRKEKADERRIPGQE